MRVSLLTWLLRKLGTERSEELFPSPPLISLLSSSRGGSLTDFSLPNPVRLISVLNPFPRSFPPPRAVTEALLQGLSGRSFRGVRSDVPLAGRWGLGGEKLRERPAGGVSLLQPPGALAAPGENLLASVCLFHVPLLIEAPDAPWGLGRV